MRDNPRDTGKIRFTKPPMVSRQNASTMRSMAWNGAIPAVEAGIEEAMTQLHYTGITNLSANGWTWAVGGLYTKKRYLPGGIPSWEA
jgi:hypothetical protein